MYSVMVARYKHYPEVKTKGMTAAPRLVLFTSEHVSVLCFTENLDEGFFIVDKCPFVLTIHTFAYIQTFLFQWLYHNIIS